jgi:hypothetical protein
MQIKLARTGRLLKDTVQTKVLQTNDMARRASGGSSSVRNGTRHELRQRGPDMELEYEGQSKL